MSHDAANEFTLVRLAGHKGGETRFATLEGRVLKIKPKPASAIFGVSTMAVPAVLGQNGLHVSLKVNVAEGWLTAKKKANKRARCEETLSGNAHMERSAGGSLRRQEVSTAIPSQRKERAETWTPATHNNLVYTQRNAVNSIPPDLKAGAAGDLDYETPFHTSFAEEVTFSLLTARFCGCGTQRHLGADLMDFHNPPLH